MDNGIRTEADPGIGDGSPAGDKPLSLLLKAAKALAGLILLAGIALTAQMAIADRYARRGTADGLELAVAREPGNADYHRWLGVALLSRDSRRSESEFREAVRLNRRDADSGIRLALLHESQGRMAEAERELLETAQVDATFLPRWALENFEFRRNKMAEFWKWSRVALPLSFGDRTPLFDLAAATGETKISERLGIRKDEIWASYLAWALGKAAREEISTAALQMAGGRHPDGRLLSQACDRLLDLGAAESALLVWNAGVRSGALLGGSAARGRVTDPTFGAAPGESGFDWLVEKPIGGFVQRQQGGLRIHFNGDQSELSSILAQRIAVSPRGLYRVRVRFRTIEMNRNSGLRWTVISGKSQLAILENGLWSEAGGVAELSFRVPDQVNLVRLELAYQRPPGEVRAEGTIILQSVEMNETGPK